MTNLIAQINEKYNLDIKAFIFDLNGTLIDDVTFHTQVWYHLVKIMGRELTWQEMKSYSPNLPAPSKIQLTLNLPNFPVFS
jgi:beta-phosphoglucomutase-like phosphatase (HAD superfamily)